MKTEDVHLVHRLWLNITREPGLETLHHHDILTEALTRFAREYAGHDRQEILRDLRKVGSTVTPSSGRRGDGYQGNVLPPRTDRTQKNDEVPSPPRSAAQ